MGKADGFNRGNRCFHGDAEQRSIHVDEIAFQCSEGMHSGRFDIVETRGVSDVGSFGGGELVGKSRADENADQTRMLGMSFDDE